MAKEAFINKVNELASASSIGVSKRIDLYDEGISIGLKRSEIDKIIDAAIALAKVNKSESHTSASAFHIPELPNIDVPSSAFETVQPVETVEIETPAPNNEPFEAPAQETPIYEDAEPDTNYEINVEELEDLELEDPEFSEQKREPTFDEAFEEFSDNKEQQPDLPLAMPVFLLGLGSIFFATSFLGLIGAIIGLNLAANGQKAIDAKRNGFYKEQTVRYLRIGKILCFVALGLYIFRRFLFAYI